MNSHVQLGGVLGVGIASLILGATGELDPKVQLMDGSTVANWQPIREGAVAVQSGATHKLPFTLLGLASLAFVFPLSRQVDEEQQLTEHYRELEFSKLQLENQKELEAHELVAEERAKQYFMGAMGTQPQLPITRTVEVPAQPIAESAIAPHPIVYAAPAPVPQPGAAPTWTPVATAPTPQSNGCEVLDELVTSRRSTVFASATGTGKSVSQSYILNRMEQLFPKSDIWVIAQKNDSFNGLREAGRVTLFDANDLEGSFANLLTVWDIYNERRETLEGDRAKFDSHPVRLILADWHSIHGTIKDTKFYKHQLKPILSSIVTVGREFNTCFLVDTQSYNIASLGLAEDSSIRLNLNVLCQGYTFVDEHGNLQGDYAMISNLLNNRFLVPEGADILKQQYESLKGRSQAQKTPVIFTSVGRPRLALLPDLRAYKPGLLQPPTTPQTTGANDIYQMAQAAQDGKL